MHSIVGNGVESVNPGLGKLATITLLDGEVGQLVSLLTTCAELCSRRGACVGRSKVFLKHSATRAFVFEFAL